MKYSQMTIDGFNVIRRLIKYHCGRPLQGQHGKDGLIIVTSENTCFVLKVDVHLL